MQFSLGISPCPNDTFIFYALIHKKIDTENIDFTVHLQDVETLNRWAVEEKLAITKISFAQYFNISKNYILLNSGSALGNNCGPLLVCNSLEKNQIEHDFLYKKNEIKVAIPGAFTTANFLLQYAFGKDLNTVEMPFNEIENAVITNQVSAGLLIHENRFTYAEKGLHCICDLGENWEQNTGFKIPLGGICMLRNIEIETQKLVSNLIKKSIEYAVANTNETMHYVRMYAQEMDEEVMKKHIDLYVNSESVLLSKNAIDSILYMQKIVGNSEEKIIL